MDTPKSLEGNIWRGRVKCLSFGLEEDQLLDRKSDLGVNWCKVHQY